MTPAQLVVPLLATAQLSADVRNTAGDVVPGATVIWSSSDNSLATVSSDGRVTGHALGTAVIVATVEERGDSCTVIVAPIVSVRRDQPSVFAGDTTRLYATLTNAHGDSLSGTVNWTSSNGAVALVDANGVIQAVAPGVARIGATSSGGSDSQDVVVLAPTPRVNRELVVQSLAQRYPTGDQIYALWMVSPTGSGPAVRLSPDSLGAFGYDWSPDGSRLVVPLAGRASYFGTFLVTPGASPQRISARLYSAPRWAPDNSAIAYFDGITVGLMDPDGTHERLLLTVANEIAWSPDSRTVAFTFPGGFGTIRRNGSHQSFHSYPDDLFGLRWSPDGKRIAFITGHNQIVIVSPDGTNAVLLCQAGCRVDESVDWMPDAKRFIVRAGGAYRILGADGTGMTTIPGSYPQSDNYGARLSPDGTTIAWLGIAVTDVDQKVWVVGIDGAGAHAVSDSLRQMQGISWRP